MPGPFYQHIAARPEAGPLNKRRSWPISRILSAFALQASRPEALRRDDHSSRPGIARGLKRPTRRQRTGRPFGATFRGQANRALVGMRRCRPIWSCSVRGFACHHRYRRRGALLPHLFTLTPPPLARPCGPASFGGAVFFLCHYPSDCSARALPGALPSGVRTFLPPLPFGLRRGRPEGLLTVTRVRKPTIVWPTATLQLWQALRVWWRLSVGLLRYPVLLQLLVEIAAWGVDDLRGLRDVPAVLTQLLYEIGALGGVLELAQR